MAFEDRADSAGKALKESMGLEPKQVQVDGEGKERQLPPEGSYARQAMERAAEQAPPQPAPVAPEQPVEQAQPEPVEPVEEEDKASKNARARIEELARRRREEEQRRLEAETEAQTLKEQLEKERAARGSVEAEYQRFLNEQLDNLDPEQRAAVMQDARLRELLSDYEQRILRSVQAPLQEIRERELNRDLQALSTKYPGYDHDVHAEQVKDFMQRNPSTTPEQAFKAIADDDVLFLRPAGQPREGAPQFIQPRGTNGSQNYIPPPQEDPNERLRQKTREVHAMARDESPEAKRQHMREVDRLISERLFGGKS